MNDDPSPEKAESLRCLYEDARKFLEGDVQARADIARARTLNPEDMSDIDFMREYAWTVFASGMRGTTNKVKQPALARAFCGWDTAAIAESGRDSRLAALKVVNNESKVDAVLNGASWIHDQTWSVIRNHLLEGMLTTAEGNRFPGEACWAFLKLASKEHHLTWIRDTNRRYLLKNLGFDLAKDDLWLRKQAKACGYSEDGTGVQRMCEDISRLVEERVSVVDTVLWNALSSGLPVRCCKGERIGN